MTTQATQSNHAPGRRSLPSTLFAPIQTARRYMERQRGDLERDVCHSPLDGSRESSSIAHTPLAGIIPLLDTDATSQVEETPDAATVPAAISQLATSSPANPAAWESRPVAFAEVARQVWSEGLPKIGPGGAASALDAEKRSTVAQAVQVEIGTSKTSLAMGAAEEAHGLAHDANNLLSALRLYSELLCFSGVLHERHRHYAEDLRLLSIRSQGLIERLIRLADTMGSAPAAAVSVAPGPVSGEPVSLAEAVMQLRGLLGTIAHGLLEVDVSQRDTVVAVEPEALERILVNLVSNAAAAVREGGAIRIRTGVTEDGRAVLTVDDSGCGMSEAQLDVALGRRIDPGGDRGDDPALIDRDRGDRRRGLGLSIVRRLVAASGGEFFAYSKLGRGTRIEVRWPAHLKTLTGAGPLQLAVHRRPAATVAGSRTGHAGEYAVTATNLAMNGKGAVAC